MAANLDAIGIIVSHMGEAIDFYRRLGLAFSDEATAEDHAEASGPGGLRIMLDTVESVQSFSAWQPPSGSHRIALAFLCDNPAEVDELHLELTALGAPSHLAPFDAPWGQRYATVLDPSGNAIDLFAWIG
ncbi:MAG TPA: VOC family protein [Acidimicrobiia bacterium]|nr:VOC family protein [Acidimicrobiia bacterium]